MNKLTVSKTWLPPIEEYTNVLKRVWETNILTNQGDLVKELEDRLKTFTGAKHVLCVSNGTVALQLAVRALELKGKFYTSPFTYIATVAAPMWEGLKPVFVDIGKSYKKGPVIDTHVYGLPRLADVSPVIYDGSHAFGLILNNKHLVTYGDVTCVSLHATKPFQTVEGGLVITDRDDVAEKVDWLRNHGHKTRYTYHDIGINAKMSEFHAAMGLVMLPKVPQIIKRYQELIAYYNELLEVKPQEHPMTYYPYTFKDERTLLKSVAHMELHDIYPRRYFYPALNTLPFFKGKPCPKAERLAKRVVCLPLYYELKEEDIEKIVSLL